MVEIYASDASGSWTILVTRPDGAACIVASGQHFELTDDPVASADPEA